MKVGTVTKQPGEKRRWAIDYTEALDEGDSIQAVVSVVPSPAGLTVGGVHADNKVRVIAEGGTSGVTYKVTITVETTNQNEIFEDELIVKVREV
jgi:hypothetical protein